MSSDLRALFASRATDVIEIAGRIQVRQRARFDSRRGDERVKIAELDAGPSTTPATSRQPPPGAPSPPTWAPGGNPLDPTRGAGRKPRLFPGFHGGAWGVTPAAATLSVSHARLPSNAGATSAAPAKPGANGTGNGAWTRTGPSRPGTLSRLKNDFTREPCPYGLAEIQFLSQFAFLPGLLGPVVLTWSFISLFWDSYLDRYLVRWALG